MREQLKEYRALGRTGLKVSPLGLGVMTYGWGADKKAAREIFDLYREEGGNFFDTGICTPAAKAKTGLANLFPTRTLATKSSSSRNFPSMPSPEIPTPEATAVKISFAHSKDR